MANWFNKWLPDSASGGSDTTPPVVTPGFPVTSDGTVTLAAVDAASALASFDVSVKLSTEATEQVVYRGGSFVAPYSVGGSSSGDGSAGVGRTINFTRAGGWPPGAIAAFWVVAVDAAGNSTVGTVLVWSVPANPNADGFVPPSPVGDGQIDHVTSALDRLPQQFRTKPRIRALVSALVRPTQLIESALFQLLTERSIDLAVGTQLDIIGSIVGQDRRGQDDTTYRVYLYGRVAVNRSRGSTNDLLRVLNLVLLDESAQITIETIGPGFAEVRITAADLEDPTAAVAASFVQAAAGAGVRVVLISTPFDGSTFTTYGNAFHNGNTAGLYNIMQVTTTGEVNPTSTSRDLLAEFPPTGTIRIDTATAIEETIAYTSRDLDLSNSQTVLFQLVSTMTHVHLQFAQVELVDGSPGFGDSTEAPNVLVPYSDLGSTGGRISDVR